MFEGFILRDIAIVCHNSCYAWFGVIIEIKKNSFMSYDTNQRCRDKIKVQKSKKKKNIKL